MNENSMLKFMPMDGAVQLCWINKCYFILFPSNKLPSVMQHVSCVYNVAI